jgi:hypothetical protein
MKRRNETGTAQILNRDILVDRGTGRFAPRSVPSDASTVRLSSMSELTSLSRDDVPVAGITITLQGNT